MTEGEQSPSYSLKIKRSAERELRKIPSRDLSRIVKSIQALSTNLRPVGCQKLAEYEGYRVRQGDYRIVYTIDDDTKVVEVLRIGHRRDVYR